MERGERLLERRLVQQAAKALHLGPEVGPRELELRLGRHIGERPRLTAHVSIQGRERVLRAGVDEDREDVVEELVAGRSLDRPRTKLLTRLDDLLDPDMRGAVASQPFEIRTWVREPVGVIDAQSVDEPRAYQLEHFRVSGLEHIWILDAHAGQLVDREEAAVSPRLAIDVEEPHAQLFVGPEWIGVVGR